MPKFISDRTVIARIKIQPLNGEKNTSFTSAPCFSKKHAHLDCLCRPVELSQPLPKWEKDRNAREWEKKTRQSVSRCLKGAATLAKSYLHTLICSWVIRAFVAQEEERSSVNLRVSLPRPHVKVLLGKILNPTLPLTLSLEWMFVIEKNPYVAWNTLWTNKCCMSGWIWLVA